MNRFNIGYAYLLLFSALVLSGCSNGSSAETAAQPVAAPVKKVTHIAVETLAPQNLNDSLSLPGTLEAWEDLTLAAEMAGPIRWIGPKEGARIKKGQAILRIDPERHDAELARDQVEYELQKKRMERRQSLVDRKLVSQQEFEDSQKAFEQSQAQLRLSRLALEKSTLRSPVDGVLNKLMVDRGEYVSSGTAAAVVMQVDRLRVLVDVPEKDVSGMAVGKKARVFTSPVSGDKGAGVAGKVIHLSLQADPSTRTYQAKIAIDNSSGALRPGMIVQVGLTRQELAKVITVPLYALVDRDGEKVVFVEHEGKAHLRQVKVGPIVGNQAVIDSGLAPGERLIIKGQQLLGDGAAVVVEGA